MIIRSNSGGKLRISTFNSFILRLRSTRSYKRGEGDFFFSLFNSLGLHILL